MVSDKNEIMRMVATLEKHSSAWRTYTIKAGPKAVWTNSDSSVVRTAYSSQELERQLLEEEGRM